MQIMSVDQRTDGLAYKCLLNVQKSGVMAMNMQVKDGGFMVVVEA